MVWREFSLFFALRSFPISHRLTHQPIFKIPFLVVFDVVWFAQSPHFVEERDYWINRHLDYHKLLLETDRYARRQGQE